MIKKKFASVWDAISDTQQESVSMKIRSDLMQALQGWMEGQSVTQADIADLFGVTLPRVSDLARGRVSLFSTDALLDMAAKAGLSPTVTLRLLTKRAAPSLPAKQVRKEMLTTPSLQTQSQ